MTETTTRDAEIGQGIRQLVVASGTNSAAHGFHDDFPDIIDGSDAIRRALAEKLCLIHEEISEMLGELRSGRDPMEIYYVDTKGVLGEMDAQYTEQDYAMNGVPLLKPEGFLVEAADAIIRISDTAFLAGDETGEQLAFAQRIKHEYNVSREHKHGRKF